MSEIACTHLLQGYETFYALFAVAVVLGVALVPSLYYHHEGEPSKGVVLCSILAMLILFVIPTPGELSSMLSHSHGCIVSK